MKNHKILKVASTTAAASALLSVSARAGGIALYEIAAPEVGLGSAGSYNDAWFSFASLNLNWKF